LGTAALGSSPGKVSYAALAKLAATDRRPVSQYVALLIEDHVKARGSSASKE
jgi:hypothetical protein